MHHLHLTPRALSLLLLSLLLLVLTLPTLTDAQSQSPSPTVLDSKPTPYTGPLPQSPFIPTIPTQPRNANNTNLPLCIAGYMDCSTVNRRDACCALSQVCTFDSAGTLGCCEYGEKCVGKVGGEEVKSGGVARWGVISRYRTILSSSNPRNKSNLTESAEKYIYGTRGLGARGYGHELEPSSLGFVRQIKVRTRVYLTFLIQTQDHLLYSSSHLHVQATALQIL
ncbi:hypothetical protein DFH27DRAFT_527880 [Peziza echinospora]|nr:hypothetical protein DFH27DRAFT_527880 [Peziza echinospora]